PHRGEPAATSARATKVLGTARNANRQQQTEWHNIVAWGRLADLSKRFLSKGRQVYVEGRLRTREWDDRDGNKRRTVEVVATNMVLLGSRPEGMEGASSASSSYSRRSGPPAEAPEGDEPLGPSPGGTPAGGAITDDDIPF